MDQTETLLREYVIPIAIAYLLAWLAHRLSGRIVRRFMGLSDLAPEQIRLRAERRHTLSDLFASAFSLLALLMASVFTLGRFVDTTTLVWMIGLFSAAFGLGARPLISDFLTGVSFMFEDTFDVGEKVEIFTIQGVVEKINLRTTFLRAPSGELYVIPNGEVRVIRNFSRGHYSQAKIKLKLPARELERTLEILEELAQEALLQVPDLLEPWQILSETGEISEQVDLTLVYKTSFGKAAELRPRLLALVQGRLSRDVVPLKE